MSAISTHSYDLVCASDYTVIGFQPWEKVTSVVRVVCTLVSVSIISSWCSRRNVGKLLLFFSHWLSGLMHQLAELVLAEMVLLCLAKSELVILIKVLKFIELVGGNMLAFTNVAICFNLAVIVASHRTMSRVNSVSSPTLVLSLLGISVLTTVAVVPFWDEVVMSGTLLWVLGKTAAKRDWVLVATFFLELLAGIVMSVIVALLLVFRLPELRQAWYVHRRIKFYFGLTAIAIIVDLCIGIGGVLYLTTNQDARFFSATWTMRHIHIALDTLVLYSALGESHFEIESTHPSGSGSDHAIGSGVNGHAGPKQLGMPASFARPHEAASSSVQNSISPVV